MLHISFFIYFFAGFVGFSVIALIVLINKKHCGERNAKISLLLFVLSSVLLGLLYFFEAFYLDLYSSTEGRTWLERSLDISLYLTQAFFWFRYLQVETGSQKSILSRSTTLIIFIIFVLLIIPYIFFMDGNYYIYDRKQMLYTLAIQILLILSMIILNSIYVYWCTKRIDDRENKIFSILITSIIMINGIWNGIYAIILIWGKTNLIGYKFDVYDPTSILLFMLNLFTMIFIFKKDFSHLYLNSQNENTYKDMEGRAKDLVKEKGLSDREHEVLLLLINGDTYAQIGDKLYISKHTVKRHVHNIYNKTEASNKIDLINLLK